MLKRLSALFFVAAVSSCLNDSYQAFYQPYPNADRTEVASFNGEPRVTTANPNSDSGQTVLQMYKDGYIIIGSSNFIGPAMDASAAANQAKRVGAAVVVVSQNYRNSSSGNIPYTRPTSSTTYISGTLYSSNFGNPAIGTYTGTITTYGSQTTTVPYSVDRYDQQALFFAPLKRQGMGLAFFTTMTPDMVQEAGTNQALKIAAIRSGSPAAAAGIVAGDFIVSVDGIAVTDKTAFELAQKQAKGRAVDVVFIRKGVKTTATMTIPNGDW